MSDRDDERDALAAEYVLGLLEGEALAEAERRLASEASFAAEVADWRRRLADLDSTAAPQAAGETLWQRIESGLALDARPAAVPTGRTAAQPFNADPWWSQLWQSLVFWRGFSVATAAAAAALLVVLGTGPVRQDAPAFVAVMTTDAGRPGAVLHAYADGRVTLIPLAVAPIPQGRALQVWTKPTPTASPVAIGLMDQVRTIRLDVRNLSPAQLNQHFAVSLEPAGGSPTGLPTGPVLLQGDLASAR